jgi:hypothetical protein
LDEEDLAAAGLWLDVASALHAGILIHCRAPFLTASPVTISSGVERHASPPRGDHAASLSIQFALLRSGLADARRKDELGGDVRRDAGRAVSSGRSRRWMTARWRA